MSKLWGGRFRGAANEQFARFNASFRFDRRLFEADVRGSIAYGGALRAAGVLSTAEAEEIRDALETILRSGSNDPKYLDQVAGAEDVHSFVERKLVDLIGDVGYKLHTGRSRNDQVSTDLRIFLRGEIDRLGRLIDGLQRSLLDLAEENPQAVLPGYTHMQKAQPVLFAHYLLAYFEMFNRDRDRLIENRRRVNVMPLGSGALAGTNFAIDRELLAQSLEFEAVSKNSLDAVSDRDFVIELAANAALTMVHLSRMAEDFVLYSTTEFGYLELGDAVATGSSLMPQKKNPDSLELIRGKSGRVFGHHAGLLATMKGLPLAYNKDMQEDKEAVFDTLDTLSGCLHVMTTVLKSVKVHTDRMLDAAQHDYMTATEVADYLVHKGLQFRKAHELVGKIVLYAMENGQGLSDLTMEQYQRFSPLFEDDLYDVITLAASLAGKAVTGGTSPERVTEAITEARIRINANS
ncbi:MAG: argininosuccinate lyase [Acidobacteria bacterium]|nr:argininosuccinate lyase [Acidobacteriota bacterium]